MDLLLGSAQGSGVRQHLHGPAVTKGLASLLHSLRRNKYKLMVGLLECYLTSERI